MNIKAKDVFVEFGPFKFRAASLVVTAGVIPVVVTVARMLGW